MYYNLFNILGTLWISSGIHLCAQKSSLVLTTLLPNTHYYYLIDPMRTYSNNYFLNDSLFKHPNQPMVY